MNSILIAFRDPRCIESIWLSVCRDLIVLRTRDSINFDRLFLVRSTICRLSRGSATSVRGDIRELVEKQCPRAIRT